MRVLRSLATLFGCRRTFLRETRGGAAVEVVLILPLLIYPIMNVVELGAYVMRGMQVASAADQAVHAIRRQCGFNNVPVTDPANCSATTVNSAATTAVQGTSLGTAVTVASGYPNEQYYCVNSSNTLVAVGTAGTPGTKPVGPSDMTCSTVTTGSAAAPSDYLKVRASYTFTPVFSSATVVALLPSPITRTAWLRLG